MPKLELYQKARVEVKITQDLIDLKEYYGESTTAKTVKNVIKDHKEALKEIKRLKLRNKKLEYSLEILQSN